jgi:DNA mismatch endonuclease (patch repair protein)
MDVFDPRKRSMVMSLIRSKGNKGTELALASLMRRARITGWRRHIQLPGKPDFTFREKRLTVFVDGCFWHKCPRCYREPKSRKDYWVEKIRRNQERDRKWNRVLRSKGWAVIRIWECELEKEPAKQLQRIVRAIHFTSTPSGKATKSSVSQPKTSATSAR